jgi:hypothetical protein
MSGFQWFRKLMGGTWYYVSFRSEHGACFLWTRNPKSDRVIETEVY